MVTKVEAYNPEGENVGYVRVDTDEVGDVIGEVYDTQADRLGAIRYEPMRYEPKESLIYNQAGARIGFVRLVRDAEGNLEGTVYILQEAGTEAQPYAYLHQNLLQEENFLLRRKDRDGEDLGWLKPQNASEEQVILMGGGAGLLLLA
jgi:hypothetical protein